MIKLLKEAFDSISKEYQIKYIGDKIYLKISTNKYVQVSFISTQVIDAYNCIKMVLLHTENGILHDQIVTFTDIFSNTHDISHPYKIDKCIKYQYSSYGWYGKPTEEDFQALQNTLKEYISIWI